MDLLTIFTLHDAFVMGDDSRSALSPILTSLHVGFRKCLFHLKITRYIIYVLSFKILAALVFF